MEKIRLTLVSVVIAFCCSSAFAGGSKPASSAALSTANSATQTYPVIAKTNVAATKKAPSFLFVMQAKQGKIETKDGKTYLVLKHTDAHHVIMFSDRPNRIVKYITGNDLQKLWKVGKDSFEKDPPNAVLSSAGQKAQIIILNGIEVTKDTVAFPLSISAMNPTLMAGIALRTMSSVILMIDDCQVMCNFLNGVPEMCV